MCYCPLLRDRDKFPRIFLHYAHSTETQDCSDWQILVCHLRQVALRAAALGNKFGAAKAAALAGWLLGETKANAQVAGFLFNAAKNGNVTAQIFWLKTRAKWRESPVELKHSGAIALSRRTT